MVEVFVVEVIAVEVIVVDVFVVEVIVVEVIVVEHAPCKLLLLHFVSILFQLSFKEIIRLSQS